MNKISNLSYINFLKKSGISIFLQDYPNDRYETKKYKFSKKIINKIEDVKNHDQLIDYIGLINSHKPRGNLSKNLIYAGNPSSNIMIIVNNPYAGDKQSNNFLSGEEGALIDKMLKAIKLDRSKVYVTNLIPFILSDQENLSTDEKLEYLSIIQKHIELINPKIIVLLGESISKIVLNTSLPFEEICGKWHSYNSLNLKEVIKVLVSYDPHSLISNPDKKKNSWEDLKNLKREIFNENK